MIGIISSIYTSVKDKWDRQGLCTKITGMFVGFLVGTC